MNTPYMKNISLMRIPQAHLQILSPSSVIQPQNVENHVGQLRLQKTDGSTHMEAMLGMQSRGGKINGGEKYRTCCVA